MNIQKQVCTWEQALQLKNLGIKQEGYFTWMECRLSNDGSIFNSWWAIFRPNNGEYDFMTDMLMPQEYREAYPDDQDYQTEKEASAFTAVELGIMLPDLLQTDRQYELVMIKEDNCWLCRYCAGNAITNTIKKQANIAEETLPQAMAAMLIHLLQNSFISSNDINKLL